MSKLLAKARDALQRGQFSPALEAITACEQAGSLALQHYMVRGLAQIGLADWQAAAETFRCAAQRYHANHEVWAYLGIAKQNINDKKEKWAAVESFERSLELNPNNGIAAANLAELYRQLGRFTEAEQLALRGAKHHPDKPWALNILGLIVAEQGRFAEAQKIYEEALKLDPVHASLTFNLATLHSGVRNFSAAWPLFARAQTLSPALRMKVGEALARLLAGDYQKGWEIYEARRSAPNGSMHVVPSGENYNGQPTAGKKIAIVAEQGFGDMLHFCRFRKSFAPDAHLSWIVQKALLRLFRASFPDDPVYELGTALPEFDYHLPMMSLALYTQSYTPDLWPMPPYLVASEGPKLPETGREGPKIGIIWAGAAGHERDHHRSMPFSALAPLWNMKAQFYAPFLSNKLNDITNEPIMRLDHLIKDFGDTAALMKQMDAIVSVDTSACHLAGGLGLKMFLLINYIPEWRWGVGGESTAWYPSATVLRQPAPGDWGGVIRQLEQRLQALT